MKQLLWTTPKWINLPFIIICLSSFLFFSSHYLLSPILPAYFKSLSYPGTTIGSVIAAFMVASLMIRPWAGRWADKYSKKKLLVFSIFLFAFCSAAYALTLPAWVVYFIRIAQGAAYALFYTTSAGLVTQLIPNGHQAEGLSYYSNANKLAMAFAPPIGLLFIQHHQMLWAMGSAGALGLITLLCLLKFKFQETSKAPASLKTLEDSPLLNKKAVFPGLVMLTNSMAFGALIPFLPLIAAEKHLENAGLFYIVYAIFLIFSRTLTGRLSDVYGRDRVLIPGLIMVSLTLATLATAQNPIIFLMAAGAYGLSAGTIMPSLMALSVDQVSPQERGSAMGTFTLLSDLGIALGSFLMGTLGEQIGYSQSLWVMSLSALLGLGIFIIIRRRTKLHHVPAQLHGV